MKVSTSLNRAAGPGSSLRECEKLGFTFTGEWSSSRAKSDILEPTDIVVTRQTGTGSVPAVDVNFREVLYTSAVLLTMLYFIRDVIAIRISSYRLQS